MKKEMSYFSRFVLIGLCFTKSAVLWGISNNAGTNSSSLDQAVARVNVGSFQDIFFNFLEVTLTDQVRAVQSDPTFTFVPNSILMTGNGATLNGQNTTRGFFVGGQGADGSGSVTINNLNFINCRAKGGDGNSGGGGGLGAGGGLFVGQGTNVFLQDCTFSNCSAKGGSSIADGFFMGGGGGMRGNGGKEGDDSRGGGGGGFGGNGADGELGGMGTSGGGGGASGFPDTDAFHSNGNAVGESAGQRFSGSGASGTGGVGGDGVSTGNGNDAGFGGGGGGAKNENSNGTSGGNGDFGGGGGGGYGSNKLTEGSFSSDLVSGGGNSGFGGGGGGGGAFINSGSSLGGFGGGGGGSFDGGDYNNGGFGGGNGSLLSGGKGAGFGGAIFIQSGGNLTIKTTSAFNKQMFDQNSAAAGDTGSGIASALGQDIFMMSSSSMTFDLAAPVTIQNPIEGDLGGGGGSQATGGLTKKGSALLTLSGDNTYTGTTSIEGGELRINGSVISEIEIQENTTLSGNFTAKKMGSNPNSGNIVNRGRLSPGLQGDGSGTISIEGDFTNESTGTLAIDITPTGNTSDKIFMSTGNTFLNGGQLEVFVGNGNYIAGTRYEVILGTVTGAFGNQDNPTQVGPSANTIDIEISTGSLILTVTSNSLFEHQLIQSGVPQQVANCITTATITPGSDFAIVVEALGALSNSEVNAALTSLSAVQFGALEWINARNNSYAADILSQHLGELCCNPRQCGTNAWVSVFGNLIDHKKPIDNLQKFEANARGILLGLDSCIAPCFSYGRAFGYTYTDLLWKDNGGKGIIHSYYGALYARLASSWLSADLSFLGGGSNNDTKRNIVFSTINRTAKGDFWSYFLTGHLGLQGEWNSGCAAFQLFALSDYHYYMHKRFTEKGAESVDLQVHSKIQQMIRGEAGWKWSYKIDCGYYSFSPYLGVSWVGEFPLRPSKQPASFTGQSCVINAESYDSTIHLGAPQAGFQLSFCKGVSFTFGYKGLYNNKIRIHEMEGSFEWLF